MKLRRNKDLHTRRQPRLPLILLVNIIFLLLIFFIMAGTIAPTDPVRLKLPRAETGAGFHAAHGEIIVTREGDIVIAGQAVPLHTMEEALKLLAKENPDTLITIRADAGGNASRLIDLLSRIEDIGLRHVGIVTEPRQ